MSNTPWQSPIIFAPVAWRTIRVPKPSPQPTSSTLGRPAGRWPRSQASVSRTGTESAPPGAGALTAAGCSESLELFMKKRLQELAFLNRGVRIVYRDERNDQGDEFCYERGII